MAAVTAAVATAYSAYAAKSASDKQVKATKKGLDQTAAMAEQSRNDALMFYSAGRKSAQSGLNSAFNFYKQSAPARYQPIMQGGLAAQNVIGQGAKQANNAILGLPVDMSFTNAQQIQPDMSFIQNVQLPAPADYPVDAAAKAAAQAAQFSQPVPPSNTYSGQGNALGRFR